jgi:hypothetical protein
MEPVPKRPRTDDAPPKAERFHQDSDEVVMTTEFFVVLTDLINQFLRDSQSLAMLAR